MSQLTAAARGLMSCESCLKLVPVDQHVCPRCGATVHLRHPDTIQRTFALLVTATILYLPANLLPIMYTDQLGITEPSTIMGGVLLLIKLDSVPIAAIIFIASVMVPLGKLATLYYLCWSVSRAQVGSERQRTVLYRATEFIGKWSMADVFVVAILVALVQVTGLIAFRPGPAALAFAGVVITTMLAAEGFDQRLIWDAGAERPAGQPGSEYDRV
jgi:paraquat-inducible protein A